MQKLFNNILVPFDFSPRSYKAIDKSIELANQFQCNIILLHVVTIVPFASIAAIEGHADISYTAIDNQIELNHKLDKIIAGKQPRLIKAQIKAEVVLGTWNECVIEFIKQNNIDLVVVGQKIQFYRKRKMFINPDRVAEKSNIPVITVPSNRRLTRLFSVLIPITDFLPVRKLMYGVYLAKYNNASIKLLSVQSDKNREVNEYYLQKAHQLIKDNCNLDTELVTIKSNNATQAVYDYTAKHNTDILILNPHSQTKMPGFFSALLGNIIQKYSPTPILTVNPL